LLIFDIEITLLIPLVFLTKPQYYHLFTYIFFTLIYGLYIEYLEYSID